MTEVLIEGPAAAPPVHRHGTADFVAVDVTLEAVDVDAAFDAVLAAQVDSHVVGDDERMRRRERLLHQLALERQRHRRRRSA